jgi:hypothetical protein
MNGLRIRPMRPDEISIAVNWAAAEGWNPGFADDACFAAADPEGFSIGELEGAPAATVSCKTDMRTPSLRCRQRTAHRDLVKVFHSSQDDETILTHVRRHFPKPRSYPEAHACYDRVGSNKVEVTMKKHQTIIGFVAVVLLAAAATATAATMRSPAPSTQIAPAGIMSLTELAGDVNKLPIEEFEDMSLVYSTGTKH